MTAEKEEYVRIYEDIKRRQAAYSAAHPGKYYLLSDEEMDDIESYYQIKTLERAAKRYQERKKRESNNVIRLPIPTRPQKTLREHVEEMVAEQAEQLRLKQFEESLDEIVREMNYYHWARSCSGIDYGD